MLARFTTLMFCLCAAVCAQVTPAEETLLFRDGSGNTQYICVADGAQKSVATFSTTASQSNQPYSSIAKVNLVSIADATNTATITTDAAHGLAVGHRITIQGATVATALNGDYTIATVPSGTTFTITTANVADSTYTEAGLRFTTKAPRSNSNVWSVQKLFYTTTSLDRTVMAHGDGSRNRSCDSRATLFQ